MLPEESQPPRALVEREEARTVVQQVLEKVLILKGRILKLLNCVKVLEETFDTFAVPNDNLTNVKERPSNLVQSMEYLKHTRETIDILARMRLSLAGINTRITVEPASLSSVHT